MVLRLHGAHLPCSPSWEKWKGLPWDENTAQTPAKKKSGTVKKGNENTKEHKAYFVSEFLWCPQWLTPVVPFPADLKALCTMECQQRGEGTQNSAALQALLSKSRSLGILRAWTVFTWLHILAGLISVIICFLFTTMPWQQGINTHRQEKDSNVNTWLQNTEETFLSFQQERSHFKPHKVMVS